MTSKKEIILDGLPISEGISIGKPYFFMKAEDPIPAFFISEEEIKSEISRYRKAILKSEKDLKKLQKTLKLQSSYEAVDILNSHLEILQDPFLTSEIEKRICNECRNIESIFQDSIIEFKARFQDVDDAFFQERIRDIIDVARRILHHLRPANNLSIKNFPSQSIIIAAELVPSDIAEVEDEQIKAFVTQRGGVTSHSAIIARAKRIPYVAGIDITKIQKENIETIIVDGSKGKIIINPESKTLIHYKNMSTNKKIFHKDIIEDDDNRTETKDGFPIQLFGNIDSIEDADFLLKHKSAGVGLFRSEYLFLKNHEFPSEDNQFKIYKRLAEKLGSLPLVVRVFDIGGDKNHKIHYNESLKDLMNELNPVLGCRAIRFLIRHPDHLRTQLKAILRASAFGKICILVPMVTDINELFFVKNTIRQLEKEFTAKGVNFDKNISLGCMIEVPSSAIMSDVIAKDADFLSIGTNDLIQYVLAADRTNPSISNLYSPVHPSILRLIIKIVESAKKFSKPLILCGETAADPKLIPILLGLGIKEFSVSVRHIPIVKRAIRKVNLSDALQFAKKALKFTNSKDLMEFIQKINEKNSWIKN